MNTLHFRRCYYLHFTRHSEPSGCKPQDNER